MLKVRPKSRGNTNIENARNIFVHPVSQLLRISVSCDSRRKVTNTQNGNVAW